MRVGKSIKSYEKYYKELKDNEVKTIITSDRKQLFLILCRARNLNIIYPQDVSG